MTVPVCRLIKIDYFRCGYNQSSTEEIETLDLTVEILGEAVPAFSCSVMLITTGALLVFVRSVVGLNRKAVLVNIFISACYLVTIIPFLIWTVFKETADQYQTLWMFAMHIYYCSLFCNPVIYYATSRSFQQHTNSCFSALYKWIMGFCRRDNEEDENLIQEEHPEEVIEEVIEEVRGEIVEEITED